MIAIILKTNRLSLFAWNNATVESKRLLITDYLRHMEPYSARA